MPARIFKLTEDRVTYEDEGIFFCDSHGGLVLRPVDDDGIYDPINGSVSRKYVDLSTWCPYGEVFEEFAGFFIPCRADSQGSLGVQISPDGGETFFWFNGTVWTESSLEDDYNSVEEIELNLPTYPIWTNLRIRIIVIPDSNGNVPIFPHVVLFFEVRPHEIKQDIYRSLKRFILGTSNFVLPHDIMITEETDEISLTFEDVGIEGEIEKPIGIKEPIWVFEMDTDPKLRDNLFASFDGKDFIKLKRKVAGRIRILFTAIPDIHIQTDFDVVRVANHPSIVLQIVSMRRSEWDGPGGCSQEINYSEKRARLREAHRKYEVKVLIRAYSSKVTDSLMYSGGVRRLIEQEDRILSVFYDIYMQAMWGDESNNNWVTSNWFVESYTPMFIWDDWNSQGKAREVPLVDSPENGGGVFTDVYLLDNC